MPCMLTLICTIWLYLIKCNKHCCYRWLRC